MEINKLRTFVDLANTLSFSQTAENLYITQSSVSKQINSLEKDLGHKLFVRNNKQVSLTDAGEAILSNCQLIISQEDRLISKLHQIDQHKNSLIKMAVIPTFSSYPIFNEITKYIDSNPEIDFQLLETESNDTLNLLKKKDVDLAFYRSLTKKVGISDIEYLLLRKEKFALCVAEDDKLAQKEKIDLKDISGESYIMLAQNSQLYQPVINLCKQAGFKPNIVFTSDRMSSIIEMIKNHQGVAILMNSGQTIPGVKFIEIEPTQESYLYLLRRKDNNNLQVKKLWNYVVNLNHSKME